jgi:uncharacterized protein YbjT (DUF2867 family)
MRVLIFGATGMVGQGVLRECLRDRDVEFVQTIGRTPTGQLDPRLREIVHRDMTNYSSIEESLTDFDACFFCLGVSSVGMSEADYTRVTHDITLAAAKALARLSPQMTFVFVSGAGTDSTEKGRSMWARVKGRTENALQRLPFRAVYLFRPGVIQPLNGIHSKTRLYRAIYALTGPLLTTLRVLLPSFVQTTATIGQAMLAVARDGAPTAIVEARDIAAIARAASRRADGMAAT